MDLTRFFHQTISHWTSPVADGVGGYSYAAPVTFSGRWEDSQVLFIDAQGKEVRSEAVVHCTETITNGDYLFLGTSVAADPTRVTGAKEVRAVRRSPSLDATQFLVKAWM